MTKKEAKRLSILKWEYIIAQDGSEDELIEAIPELVELISNCGYCEKYVALFDNCPKCPLTIIEANCCEYTHPFYKWFHTRTKENAQAVLDLILES